MELLQTRLIQRQMNCLLSSPLDLLTAFNTEAEHFPFAWLVHTLCAQPPLLSSANSGTVRVILFWKDPFGHITGPGCEHGIDSGKEACHGLAWANATYSIQNDWLPVTDMVAPINLFHKYILVKSDQRD